MLRSHHCGELRLEHVNEKVVLTGWVQRSRDKGGVIWIDLRDRYGLTQLIFEEGKTTPEVMEIARSLGREFVIKASGTVAERYSKNDKLATGDIEINVDEIEILNYASLLNASEEEFLKFHSSVWEENIAISENFFLIKQKKFFSEITDKNTFNLIYFDAFGIRVQPELWTEEIFSIMHRALKPNGILVTYAANGNARRALQTVGFKVERLPGPPGKKEMLRATKV